MLSVAAVGETTDDCKREEEDRVFCNLPRHRHHLRGVVALRSYRQNSGGNQARSAHSLTLQRLTLNQCHFFNLEHLELIHGLHLNNVKKKKLFKWSEGVKATIETPLMVYVVI